jgi:maltoporin
MLTSFIVERGQKDCENGVWIKRPNTYRVEMMYASWTEFLLMEERMTKSEREITIAPTIQPKGGYFTRPEPRFFATYAIWSDSLRGATTPIQQSGNLYAPPYNGNTNQGWLFGTQVEWFY